MTPTRSWPCWIPTRFRIPLELREVRPSKESADRGRVGEPLVHARQAHGRLLGPLPLECGCRGAMYWYKIGWGGSLAISTNFLRQSDLRQRLAHAFGEDSTICRCARAHGYGIAFSPSLVMVNRETCNVKGVFGFSRAAIIDGAFAQPLVVGRGRAWHRHNGYVGAFLSAGHGSRGNCPLERGGLDRHGPEHLLGIDGPHGHSLGMLCPSDYPGSR